MCMLSDFVFILETVYQSGCVELVVSTLASQNDECLGCKSLVPEFVS